MRRLRRSYLGNPILRAKAKRVTVRDIKTPQFQKLIRQMIFTMRRVGGVGLAAPQIGKSLQLAVLEIRRTELRPSVKPLSPTVIINPVVLSHSKEQVADWEGCLSFPGVRGLVPRYKEIEVAYLDGRGEKRMIHAEGFQARVFQHEIDHLNGAVYVDRMEDMRSLMTIEEFEGRILRRGGLRSK